MSDLNAILRQSLAMQMGARDNKLLCSPSCSCKCSWAKCAVSPRDCSWRQNSTWQSLLEKLPFVLSKKQQDAASLRLLAVQAECLIPSKLQAGLWHVFDSPRLCETHDYVVLGGPLIMYAVEGMLGEQAANAYSMVFEALGRLWAKSFKRSELDSLNKLVHRALLHVHVHIHLPSVHNDILIHLLHHIVDDIHKHGPPWSQTMLPYEGQWRRLDDQNHSSRFPAHSMMLNLRAGHMSTAVLDILGAPHGQVNQVSKSRKMQHTMETPTLIITNADFHVYCHCTVATCSGRLYICIQSIIHKCVDASSQIACIGACIIMNTSLTGATVQTFLL